MTNKEKYKQAFSAIHASENLTLEVEKMERINRKQKYTSILATAAAVVLIFGSATGAYAADIGGIQRTVQLWVHGDQTQASIQFDGNGNYDMTYTNEGKEIHQGGGGVVTEVDGTERPATEEELMAEMNQPDVQYEDDGTVWVYWYDQKIEITDKFKDDICYVKLDNGKETLYMTVRYQDGFSTSPDKYILP